MNVSPLIPIILCGGSGTRLWPLSRESFPKQYLSFDSNDNKSLLQKTHERIKNLENIKNPILVCNEDHRFIVAEQMREINVKPQSILLEPFGRNTAAAIALASLTALEKESDPTLIVLSSDHEIKDTQKFLEVIKKGINYAKNDYLVTFGVIPISPETGYGYIKSEKPFVENEIVGYKISKFTEKPDKETAEKFILDKRYTWNSGVFMFKAKTILSELKKFSPDVVNFCRSSLIDINHDFDFKRINRDSFKKCPNISIDIAVMEKTKKGIVLPFDAGWNDIGSWKSVWETSLKDKKGNYTQGKTLVEDCSNCYIRSEARLVVGIGINNLIVIETNDAILISNRSETQKVKNIVKKLKEKNIPEGQKHQKIYRPWGHYLSVAEDRRWQLKLIEVKPGEKLSLQMHHHRSEHWVVVNGTAKVELDRESKVLTENQSVYIPLGAKHRLSNPGKIPLILIEVQSGSYVGEDDIVRFEDKYGR